MLALPHIKIFGLAIGWLVLIASGGWADENRPLVPSQTSGWVLHLYAHELELLSPEILRLQNLTRLDFSQNVGLTQQHFKVLAGFEHLEELDLAYCQLEQIPAILAGLSGLHSLRLQGNRLTAIPEALFSAWEKMEVLDLSQNRFETIPHGIVALPHLRSLNLSYNKLTALPNDLDSMHQLRILDLSNNRLTGFPDTLLRLPQLEMLNLSHNNRLSRLPNEIEKMTRLEALDLSRCGLTDLPASICKLSALKRLCFDSSMMTRGKGVWRQCLKKDLSDDCPPVGARIAIIPLTIQPHIEASDAVANQTDQKNTLLINIIANLLQASPYLPVDIDGLLNLEARQNFDDAGARKTFRLILLDFLLACTNRSETFESRDEAAFLSQFERYRQQHAFTSNQPVDVFTFDSSFQKHTLAVLQWQLTSSQIIFCVVIGIVCIGLGLAVIQFIAALKMDTKRPAQSAAEAEPELGNNQTEIELTLQSVKIKTSLIGVIVLIISLAFFYLYLIHVYPIEEIASARSRMNLGAQIASD
jgi:Leucine-rich repeat (LRR) protein